MWIMSSRLLGSTVLGVCIVPVLCTIEYVPGHHHVVRDVVSPSTGSTYVVVAIVSH